MAAQLDQLRAVAQTHDIDLVLVGLGSNNSSFTFGSVAEKCANRFIADAWTGWWEFWAYLDGPVEQKPCTDADLATAAQLSAATAETTAAVRQILTTLDQVDADGQHRVVFQDYTNPLPLDLNPQFHEEDSRDDTRDKFRDLGAERYAAGCPIHRASLAPGHRFSQGLGTIVKSTRRHPGRRVPRRRPGLPQRAAGLRRRPALRARRAARPARWPPRSGSRTAPTGAFVTSLAGKDKIAIQRIANTCVTLLPDLPGVVAPERRRAPGARPVPDRRGLHQRPRRWPASAPATGRSPSPDRSRHSEAPPPGGALRRVRRGVRRAVGHACGYPPVTSGRRLGR